VLHTDCHYLHLYIAATAGFGARQSSNSSNIIRILKREDGPILCTATVSATTSTTGTTPATGTTAASLRDGSRQRQPKPAASGSSTHQALHSSTNSINAVPPPTTASAAATAAKACTRPPAAASVHSRGPQQHPQPTASRKPTHATAHTSSSTTAKPIVYVAKAHNSDERGIRSTAAATAAAAASSSARGASPLAGLFPPTRASGTTAASTAGSAAASATASGASSAISWAAKVMHVAKQDAATIAAAEMHAAAQAAARREQQEHAAAERRAQEQQAAQRTAAAAAAVAAAAAAAAAAQPVSAERAAADAAVQKLHAARALMPPPQTAAQLRAAARQREQPAAAAAAAARARAQQRSAVPQRHTAADRALQPSRSIILDWCTVGYSVQVAQTTWCLIEFMQLCRQALQLPAGTPIELYKRNSTSQQLLYAPQVLLQQLTPLLLHCCNYSHSELASYDSYSEHAACKSCA
jgi:trimeric autotransporter adhesin